MIAVVTVLSAFALGFLMKSRLAANTTYAVAYLWAFTYQTLYLTIDSFSGTSDNPAFDPSGFPLAYGVVTLAIFLVGFGLVEAGRRVAARRRSRRAEVSPA
jgi:hypothetical protein